MNYPIRRFIGAAAGVVLTGTASLWAGTPAPDLKNWAVEGAVVMDAAKPGPDGAPSIQIAPGAKAVLKLRAEDGSGKVTLHVYDDGTVGTPGKVKATGPRWGLQQADGRVLLGAIMYARYLHADGSVCLIDTLPTQRDAWNAVKFLSPRGQPGWHTWEFLYDPEAGLSIKIDGAPVAARYFDWNSSQASGFNGIVLYGDESTAAPQTLWVSGVDYELGGPMKVRPNPQAALEAARAAALAKADASKKPAQPAAPREKWTGGFPGPTLADDLDLPQTPLVAGYADAHPRLLFSASAREALQSKAKENPELWQAVLANAKRATDPATVPTPEAVMEGKTYWRVEYVESAALAWFVTGDAAYRDGAIRWLVAHCREPVWGTNYRPNLDLQASWYLYYLSLAYDLLHDQLNDADRAIVRDGLALHAKAIFDDFDPVGRTDKIRYDQNHTYTPIVALIAGSLALMGEEPDAAAWLERARAVLRRSRYVLGEDGYYYEGFGYWTYALHWHVRGAELLGRATGEKLFDLPALRDNWLYGLHLSLPGKPGAFDVGDTGLWKADNERPDIRVNNSSMLWAIATATGSRESRMVGDLYAARAPEMDFPSSAFLWFDAKDTPAKFGTIKPYHSFKDHDVVTWRSGWGPEATAYLFRSGPPLGHAAAAKLGQLKDWTMNTGHVHADIGAFYMYAKGAYLAVGTGYTAEKWTRDQNTLLIDGKGQAVDGDYHNGHGVPYAQLDGTHIERTYLSSEYGYVSREFGSAYTRQVKDVTLRRSLLMTERWLLVIDDMSARDGAAHRLTWLCHADAAFRAEGTGDATAFVAQLPQASLMVLPLAPEASAVEAKSGETTVMAGMAPGRGQPAKHGFQLELTAKTPTSASRFVNLLVPLGAGEKAPAVENFRDDAASGAVAFTLRWADGKTEAVRLNLNWSGAEDEKPGPAEITLH
jgi:hypothetical protein